ncbi:hypothetical protein N9L47_06565 [Rhodobacteraceae bacterium]|nr:hypothetical protein [Paracoccaceae bacterium]
MTDVQAIVPSTLTVSEDNSVAPNANIVWRGEPLGDRRAQVAKIMKEGIEKGAAGLNGNRRVIIIASLREFHAVTPKAIVIAPGAVHNIQYNIQVVDAGTGAKLTEPTPVTADLEAFVKEAAVTAAVQGNTQRVRIVNHLARVTEAWLGIGPDASRRFSGFGR